MSTIDRLESEVRSYCRSFPTVFDRAEGAVLYGESGKPYLDFFSGAGALNYGHNHPVLRDALLNYITHGGVVHSLDMTTAAKCAFLEAFEEHILLPRNMSYKVMFPGPTGTNAVEAALKLARKVTQRMQVVSFTNGFHGMTLGALAVTGNAKKRTGAGVPLGNVTHAPFDGYFGPTVDTLEILRTLLGDASSGVDAPAAFLVETIQAEGGVNVARKAWLQGLAQLAKDVGALLIVDDIQVGCGRTGSFFSFEEMGIQPDIICLSKSLSGYGVPFAATLLRPEIDLWAPGEHNGTFRGHNLAFVTAAAALSHFWSDDAFSESVTAKAAFAHERLQSIADKYGATVRGRGLIQGLCFADPAVAQATSRHAYERGLIIETAGAEDQVVKLLPSLTIEQDQLAAGLAILDEAVGCALHTVASAHTTPILSAVEAAS